MVTAAYGQSTWQRVQPLQLAGSTTAIRPAFAGQERQDDEQRRQPQQQRPDEGGRRQVRQRMQEQDEPVDANLVRDHRKIGRGGAQCRLGQ